MENKKLKKRIFKEFGSYNGFLNEADISKPTIIDVIKKRRDTRAETVFKICKALGCEPEEVDLTY